MWEVPRFRIRAYTRTLNRIRQERERKRICGETLHLRRTHAQLAISRDFAAPITIIPARVVLNDLFPSGISLFTDRPLGMDQKVTLKIEYPRPLYIAGRVTSCRVFQLSSRILQKHPFPYRINIEFDFLNHGESEAVSQYCDELARTVLSGAA